MTVTRTGFISYIVLPMYLFFNHAVILGMLPVPLHDKDALRKPVRHGSLNSEGEKGRLQLPQRVHHRLKPPPHHKDGPTPARRSHGHLPVPSHHKGRRPKPPAPPTPVPKPRPAPAPPTPKPKPKPKPTPPAPVPTPEKLTLQIPGIGSVTLPKVTKPEIGYAGPFITKPQISGPLTIAQAELFVALDKSHIGVKGTGSLWGKPVTIVAKEFAFDPSGSALTSLDLECDISGAKDTITLSSQTVPIVGAVAQLSDNKMTPRIQIKVGQRIVSCSIRQKGSISHLTGSLDEATVGQLVPQFGKSLVGPIKIVKPIINLTDLNPQGTSRAAFSIVGNGDIKAVSLAGATGPTLESAKIIIRDDRRGLHLHSALGALAIPFFGALNDAHIESRMIKKEEELYLRGKGVALFPMIGNVPVAVNTELKAKGMTIRGKVPISLTFQNIKIAKPELVFDHDAKIITINGAVAGGLVMGGKGKMPKADTVTLLYHADKPQSPVEETIYNASHTVISHKEVPIKPTPKPVPPSPGKPGQITLSIPGFGNVTLKKVTKPEEGYQGSIANKARPIRLGPNNLLLLNEGTLFVRADRKKAKLDGEGTLFGRPVKLRLKDAVLTQRGDAFKWFVIDAYYTKEKPKLEFVPPVSLTIDGVEVALAHGNPTKVTLVGTLFGHQHRLSLTLNADIFTVSGAFPCVGLEHIIPAARKSSVGKIKIERGQMRAENIFPQTKSAQEKETTSHVDGFLNLSAVLPGVTSSRVMRAPLKSSYGAKSGSQFNIDLGTIQVPVFGSVTNAKIGMSKMMPHKLALLGDISLNLSGLPKMALELDSPFTETGIEFGAVPKADSVTFRSYLLAHPKISVDPQSESLTLTGTANIHGMKTQVRVTRDKSGKISLSIGLPGTFKLSIPGFPFSLTMKTVTKPKAGFEGELVPPGKKLSFPGFTLTSGTLFIDDNLKTVITNGSGTLFGTKLTISTKDAQFNPGTQKFSSLDWSISFPKKPTFPLFPGQNILFEEGTVLFKEARPNIQFKAAAFGVPLTMKGVEHKGERAIEAEIPRMSLGQLAPLLKGTVLERVTFNTGSLMLGKKVSPKDKKEKQIIQINGNADASSVPFSGASSSELKNAPTSFTYYEGEYDISISVKELNVPQLGIIKNAHIRAKFGTNAVPLIRLVGDFDLVLSGVGIVEIAIDSRFAKEGIDFAGTLKHSIAYKGYSLKEGKFSFSTKDKTVTIRAVIEVKGVKTTATLARDVQGKVSFHFDVSGKLTIEIPGIGTFILEAKDDKYILDITEKNKIVIGPLIITSGRLTVDKNNNLSLTGIGTLFNYGVTVGLQHSCLAGTQVESMIFGLKFNPKDEPGFNLFGLRFSFDAASINYEKGKPLALSVTVIILNQQKTYIIVPDATGYTIEGALPDLKVSQVLPPLATTPVGSLNLGSVQLKATNTFPRTQEGKNEGSNFTLSGATDISKMNMSGAQPSSQESKKAPVAVSFNTISKQVNFAINLSSLTIPVLGKVPSAKISTAYIEGSKDKPVINLLADTSMTFPGIGKIDLGLQSVFQDSGIDFIAIPKSKFLGFTYQGKSYGIEHPKIIFSQKDSSTTIEGIVNVKGIDIPISVVRDKAGKITVNLMSSVTVTIPGVGTFVLKPVEKPKPGFALKLTEEKPVSIGALTLTDATLYLSRDLTQASLIGDGRLLNRKVTVGISDAKFNKDTKTFDSLTLSITFIDKISFELFPGKTVGFEGASITILPGKAPSFMIALGLLGKKISLSMNLQTGQVAGSLPEMTLGSMISLLADTAVKDIAIGGTTVTIDNAFASEEEKKKDKPVKVGVTGGVDVSKMNLGGSSNKENFKGMPMNLSFGKASGMNLNISFPDFILPAFMDKAPLKNAKLTITTEPEEPGKPTPPAKISLGGEADFSFPGVKKPFGVDMDVSFKENEVTFAGTVTASVTFGPMTLPKVGIAFNQKQGSVTLSGDAIIEGFDSFAQITRRKDKTVDAKATLKDKAITPFKDADLVILKSLSLRNPAFEFIKTGADSFDVELEGTLDFLGMKNLSGKIIFIKQADKKLEILDINLPTNWKLSMSFPIMKDTPFDWIAIEDAHLIVAEADYTDPQTNIAYKKGVNVAGTFELSGPFAPLKLFSDKAKFTIGGHLNTDDPLASEFFAAVSNGMKVGKDVTLGPLEFFFAGKPYSFGLQGSATIQPSAKDDPIDVSCDIKIEKGFPHLNAEVDDWKKPFGIPINLKQVKFGIAFAEGTLSAFEFQGDLVVGTKELKIHANVDRNNPLATIMYGELKGSLCLSDIVALANEMSVPGKKVETKDVPSLCMRNVTARIQAPALVELKGELDLFNTTADIDFEVSPLGIIAKGTLSPTTIKAANKDMVAIKADPKSGKKGVTIDLELMPQSRKFLVTGLISVLDAISAATSLDISKSGITFSLSGDLAGLKGSFDLKAPFDIKNPAFAIRAEMKNFMGPQINKLVVQGLNADKQKADDVLKKAKSNCETAMGKGTCKKANCEQKKEKSPCWEWCDDNCPWAAFKSKKAGCWLGRASCEDACKVDEWITKTWCDAKKLGCAEWDNVTTGICSIVKGTQTVVDATLDLTKEISGDTLGNLEIDSIGFNVDLAALANFPKGGAANVPSFWLKGSFEGTKIDLDTRNANLQRLDKVLASFAQKILKEIEKKIDPNGIVFK